MRIRAPRIAAVFALSTLCLLMLGACGPGDTEPPATDDQEALEPEEFAFTPADREMFAEFREYYFSNPCDLTNAQPFNEIHDCQRLVTQDDGARAFGPLTGILPNMDLIDGAASDYATAQIAAFVVNYGVRYGPDGAKADSTSGYSPLGIAKQGTWGTPYIECLWLKDTGGVWDAALTPNCDTAPVPASNEWLLLEVVRQTTQSSQPRHYPKTARWQWTNDDPTALEGEQYIGIRCGDAWCAIFNDAANFNPPTTFPVGGGPVWRVVPGWFDTQFLAVTDTATGNLIPGPWGELYPAARGRNTPANFAAAAYIQLETGFGAFGAVSHYQGKFNVNTSTNGSTLRLRKPGMNDDYDGQYRGNGDKDAAKVTPATRQHGATGTSRWRWQAHDETLWVPCSAGCCEVEWAA